MYIFYCKRTRYIVYCVQDNGIFNIEQLLMVSLFKSTTDYIVCFSDNLELTALKYQEIIHASIFMISRQLKSSIMNIFSIHHFCEKLNIRRFYRQLIWLQYFINYGSVITYYMWLLDQKRNYIQKLSFINILTKLISRNSSTIFRFI